ncbi:MAG: thioredoxin family protein [Polyangia bacterium]
MLEKRGALSWYVDDYPAALAQARRRDLPLVIDMWSSWCHACLTMQRHVLGDPDLADVADRFVWLCADTDRRINAEMLERFPVEVWPTLYVISPRDESIQARLQGSASLSQVRRMLADGASGHRDAAGGRGYSDPSSPRELLRSADRALAAGEIERADDLYSRALEAGGDDWARRPYALTARIAALARAEKWQSCAELGLGEMKNAGRSATAAEFAYWAFVCSSQLAESNLLREAVHMRALDRLQDLADDDRAPLSTYDRSEVLRLLRRVLHEAGDREAAESVAERQLELLEEAVAQAPDARAAAVFDEPRVDVHLYLERGEELLPDLERSVRELPDLHDPPYQLARVALAAGKTDRALEAARRSLELAYGPWKGMVLMLLARIHTARGERGSAIAQLRAALELLESQPPGLRRPLLEQAARGALKEASAAAAGQ